MHMTAFRFTLISDMYYNFMNIHTLASTLVTLHEFLGSVLSVSYINAFGTPLLVSTMGSGLVGSIGGASSASLGTDG